jgi:hypothetical protein
LKLLHAATMFTAFILTVIALKAAFDSHNLHKVAFDNKNRTSLDLTRSFLDLKSQFFSLQTEY